LILYANTLYVLDYWTTKAHIGQAEQNKSNFLNSFVLHGGGDVAIIPPAISPTSNKNIGTDRWIPWSILGGTIALILGLIFLVRKQRNR
jgi:hypothetical protein